MARESAVPESAVCDSVVRNSSRRRCRAGGIHKSGFEWFVPLPQGEVESAPCLKSRPKLRLKPSPIRIRARKDEDQKDEEKDHRECHLCLCLDCHASLCPETKTDRAFSVCLEDRISKTDDVVTEWAERRREETEEGREEGRSRNDVVSYTLATACCCYSESDLHFLCHRIDRADNTTTQRHNTCSHYPPPAIHHRIPHPSSLVSSASYLQ